jgi:hypothetical protein
MHDPTPPDAPPSCTWVPLLGERRLERARRGGTRWRTWGLCAAAALCFGLLDPAATEPLGDAGQELLRATSDAPSDSWTLVVFADGRMAYRDDSFSGAPLSDAGRLTPDQLQRLRTRLRETAFFQLPPMIGRQAVCGGRQRLRARLANYEHDVVSFFIPPAARTGPAIRFHAVWAEVNSLRQFARLPVATPPAANRTSAPRATSVAAP